VLFRSSSFILGFLRTEPLVALVAVGGHGHLVGGLPLDGIGLDGVEGGVQDEKLERTGLAEWKCTCRHRREMKGFKGATCARRRPRNRENISSRQFTSSSSSRLFHYPLARVADLLKVAQLGRAREARHLHKLEAVVGEVRPLSSRLHSQKNKKKKKKERKQRRQHHVCKATESKKMGGGGGGKVSTEQNNGC
jgi:hypothetical protein